MKIFGEPEPDKHYPHRPGAYGILFDKDRIAVVEEYGKFFLPGGGIEESEDPEAALRREFLEETGLHPQTVHFMCQTGEYLNMLNGKHFFIISNFFYATAYQIMGPPAEEGHILIWKDPQSAISSLLRPGQRWAVKEALSYK